ncbi:MAG: DinB family protein [Paenibacillaceae bacterium]
MLRLFQYNWQVRNEWFLLIEQIPKDKLLRERIGGVGSILQTLFHIIDVEYSWIRGLMEMPDIKPDFKDYKELKLVIGLLDHCRIEIQGYLKSWGNEMDNKPVTVSWSENTYTYGEILRHLIAHEIHHIGQLSVWAKELDIKIVSSNFIGRGL